MVFRLFLLAPSLPAYGAARSYAGYRPQLLSEPATQLLVSGAFTWELRLKYHQSKLPELIGAIGDLPGLMQAELDRLVVVTADPQLSTFPCQILCRPGGAHGPHHGAEAERRGAHQRARVFARAALRLLAKHYVHRNQAELVKCTLKERGTHNVIDKLTVELNEKGGFYEVEFTNLGLKKVPIDVDLVKR